MTTFRFYILLLIVAAFTFSCTSKTKKLGNDVGFEINYFDNYKEVIVKSPWVANEVLERYYLVENKDIKTPENGQKVIIPLKSLGVASCTHLEFLHLLGEETSITGICSPELVYNADIRNKCTNGEIKNLGDAFDINFEQLLLLHPDAIMVSGFNQTNEKEKRIIQAGIPVIYNNEWTETSLLKRAEWIKFIAAFYNKEKEADSIYAVIEKSYNNIRELAQQTTEKPTILSGSNFKGTWYMPGGKSFNGQLFNDAGADYYYKSDSTQTSLPLNFEMVLKNFRHADYWIGCSANTMQELIASDERYALFNATKTGNVYNFNNRTTATGGNDFWESGVAHPDLILSDLIYILHPRLLPEEYKLVYMKKLE